jgi:hypothetical protein
VTQPSTVPEWREFLLGYGAEIQASERMGEAEQGGQGWYGYDPATEEAVLAAEERLGVRLPPSYRNFLLTSDGWSAIAYSLYDLLKAGEVGWFRDLEPELLASWSAPDMDYFADWAAMLANSLLITGPADGDYWVLSPATTSQDGEWTAYWWMAGDGEEPDPYTSFAELVAKARTELAVGEIAS